MEALFGALKYGSLGLAAIVAVVAGYTLRDILKEPKLSKAHQKMFNTYMVVCVILVAICAGLAIFDNQKMQNIRVSVGRLDENELHKYEVIGPLASPDELKKLVKTMCRTLIEIAEQAGGSARNCQEIVKKPDSDLRRPITATQPPQSP
jgi:hypothetical protein